MTQNLLDREYLLHRITTRIQQFLELNEIFTTTVGEIRAFLGTDRVLIYRFDADGNGEAIAESLVQESLPPWLGQHFPPRDFPPELREQFLKARQAIVTNVAQRHQILYPPDGIESGRQFAVESPIQAIVAPRHLQSLSEIGVHTSLTLPIIDRNQLWGLLAVHHTQPYPFCETTLQLLQLLSDQLSIAIAQSHLQAQTQEQSHRELTLDRIARLLHSPLNVAQKLPTVLADTAMALQGIGGRLYSVAEPNGGTPPLYTWGIQPRDPQIEDSPDWQALMEFLRGKDPGIPGIPPKFIRHPQITFSSTGTPCPFVIADFSRKSEPQPLAQAFESTSIQSILIVSLQYHDRCLGYLSIFRAGSKGQILRGKGRFCKHPQQILSWSPGDLNLAQSIGMHLHAAILQKRVQSTIEYQLSHDPLTRLPNRKRFEEQLAMALVNAQERGTMLAVVFLNLDRFRTINDTFGHPVGDRLLRKVTQRLQSCLSESDLLARWGGDEFILLFGQVADLEEVTCKARTLQALLNYPLDLDDRELYVCASFGITLAPQHGNDTQSLIQKADLAMHQAKQRGNDYQLYSPKLNQAEISPLVLENDLRKALSRNQFRLYYQPQIDLATGQVVGMEALMRWQHPEWGLLNPNKFIPIAEATGSICPIGAWAIHTACLQHQTWVSGGQPPVRMAVNLSARQFQQPDLVSTIVKILQDTGIDPQYLELEITESTAVRDVELTIAVLHQLRQMGVSIAMDDFGTGYSCLNSIKHFPLHTLKIDQSFVRDLTCNSSDAAIAQTVVALGHGLNLLVVAEGVETSGQLEFLRAIHCDLVQGYLFSQPLPAEQAVTQLEKGLLFRGIERVKLTTKPQNPTG